MTGKNNRTLYIQATNIHGGGGASLLRALLTANFIDANICLLVDYRFSIPQHISENLRIKRVIATIGQRLNAERWLARNANPGDLVLCLGNLPPLFKLRCQAIVYLQNRYIIEDRSVREFGWATRARIALERLWFRTKVLNLCAVIVQTPSMKVLLENCYFLTSVEVKILPFAANVNSTQSTTEPACREPSPHGKFVYVASGEPHKNHRCLVEAWRHLANEGLFPKLYLTVDKALSPVLCGWIEIMKQQHELKIENLGTLPSAKTLSLYEQVDALIYPSRFESFGLPLIEAKRAGLSILAPEVDYVRDVVKPVETFDSSSPTSIARAIKRFMNIREDPLSILSADDFLKQIWNEYR